MKKTVTSCVTPVKAAVIKSATTNMSDAAAKPSKLPEEPRLEVNTRLVSKSKEHTVPTRI